jgi:hypothetical protein
MLKNLSTVAVSLLAGLFFSTTTHAAAVEFDTEKIKAALHTATPEEDGFIDRALRMVDEGKLSSELVQGAFVRARKQQRRKFQQFKYGLLAQVSDGSIRLELTTGQLPVADSPPGLRERVASRLRRLFSFLPSVRALIK